MHKAFDVRVVKIDNCFEYEKGKPQFEKEKL